MYVILKNMPFLQLLLNLPLLVAGVLIKWMFFARKSLGTIYITGIYKGITGYFRKVRKDAKIPFKKQHLKNYCKIQLELWKNLLVFLKNT